MANNTRVFHVSGAYSLKHSQVVKGVTEGALVWAGSKFRNATTEESIARRNKQAKESERLAFVELPNVIYKPPIGAQAAYYESKRLAFEANRFASEMPQ